MPMLLLKTSSALKPDSKPVLLRELSRLVAQSTGKPEGYVMVVVQDASIMMAGQEGPAAWVDVRGIGGMDPSTNRKMSAAICELLHRQLGIPMDRVYLNFTDVPAGHWGWNGATFG
jgi:phenylpyruvate tautomerase